MSVPGLSRSEAPPSLPGIAPDGETYIPYERTTSLPGGQFTQTMRIIKAEQLPLAGNARLLELRPHAGARKVVVGPVKGTAGAKGARRSSDR